MIGGLILACAALGLAVNLRLGLQIIDLERRRDTGRRRDEGRQEGHPAA
jgi:hypothetical protein